MDRKVPVDGHEFTIQRSQVEKKTVRHGCDLGLMPDIGPNGMPKIHKKTEKPMTKANRENFVLFTDRLEEHMKDPNTILIEGSYRKTENDPGEAFHFYNNETLVIATFKRGGDNPFVTSWKMDNTPSQLDEFLQDKNLR